MTPLKLSITLLCCCAIQISTKAQLNHWRDSWKTNSRITSKPPTIVQRAHIGYSFMATFGTQQMKQLKYIPPNITQEEIVTRTVRSAGGSGLAVGSFITLTSFRTDVIALALSGDFIYTRLSWQELDSGFAYKPKLKDFKPTDFTRQFSVPVSLDLKLGSDAMPSNNYKWSACFGAGIFPALAFTSRNKPVIREHLHRTVNAMPFIKVEAGRRMGVLMKARLMLVFGGLNYLTEQSTIDGVAITELNNYSMTGKVSANFTLMVYPFSYKWPEYGWWQ